MIFILITLGCASASDADQNDLAIDDEISVDDSISSPNDEEVLTDSLNKSGSFLDLKETIDASTGVLELEKDYTYNATLDENFYKSGIPIEKAITIDGKGHTINGNGQARIFENQNGGFIVKNTIFINGYAGIYGGAIESNNYMKVINCTFINNQGREGGAINAFTTIYVANCTFLENLGTSSGALGIYGIVENCTFINNSGIIGAVHLYSGSLKDCKFINNTGSGAGGAITHNWGITIENCLFEGNKATGFSSSEGTGAIDFGYTDSKVTIINSTFINNTDSNGWNTKEPSLNNKFFINRNVDLINCTFENTNIRVENAYNPSITVKFEGCTIRGGSLKNIDSTLSLSKNDFGEVYIQNNAKISSQVYFIVPDYAQQSENSLILLKVVDDNGNSIYDKRILENFIDVTLENQNINLNNFIEIDGTWYYSTTRNLNEGDYSINIIVKNESFNEFFLKKTVTNGTLEVCDFNDFTSLDNAIKSGNNIIILTNDYTLDITTESTKYNNGIVIDKDNIIIDGNGHTINAATIARIFNITGQNVILRNINFKNAYAEKGGAVYSLSDVTIDHCTFTNNKAFDGAAIYIANANIIDSTFSKNIASEHGGAAYLINANITDSKFTLNSANDYGGAVYIKNKGNIKDSRFNNNTAKTGGAVYFENEANIENTAFTSNSAQNAGAAFISKGNITSSNFTSNSADKVAGAVYFENEADIKYCEFISNSAYTAGGVYFNGEMNVINSTFTINTAQENGGAVYTKKNGDIINSTFIGNVAYRGGAIINAALLRITNTTFVDNDDDYDINHIALIERGSVILNNVTPSDLIAMYPIDLVVYRSPEYYEPLYHGSSLIFYVYVTNDGKPVDTGKIILKLNGSTYNYDVIEGRAVINNLNYPVGSYSGNITFDAGVRYTKTTLPIWFDVLKQPTSIYPISNQQYTIDQEAIFIASINAYSGQPLPGQKIIFLVDGKIVGTSISNNDAVAVLELTPALLKTIKAADNKLDIRYDGDENYNATSISVTLVINKGFADITASESSYIIDQGGDYSITLKNRAGKALNAEEVIFILQGYPNSMRAFTNENGVATIKLTPDILKAIGCGVKTLEIRLNEINYQCTPQSVLLTIQKGNAEITAANSNYIINVSGDYSVTVNDMSGRVSGEQVTFTLGGNYIGVAATDSEGVATITLTPSLLSSIGYGVKDLVISLPGTNYNPLNKTVKISINDENAQIDANSTSLVYNDNNYPVKVTDGNGNPIIGEEVIFSSNGAVIGTALTDENGFATITLTSSPGNENIEVKLNDGKYTYDAKNVNITIEKGNAVITANGASYIINYGGKYSVTIKNTNGKAVSGEKVTFILNGRTVGSATTNANGVATFTLTAAMLKTAKAGSKNLVVKLDSSNYNPAAKTVKLTIKKEKTKIAAKKKTFKRATKTKKYTIALKNSKGKAVKKAKIYLKVGKKTYKAKTNSRGKATFKITKLTKKGRYTAKITFKTTAYYLKATKKVKITVK